MPNRLAQETSPYLLQHATNPVDWYPWGPEALKRAQLENLPIFLSIGYAACHWCHVMERESFQDSDTASFMNAHFVCVKVDREERPDLDSIYMQAVVMLAGRGGWPMSVWLTPDGRPFYGGTYFPPTPQHGMPSFRQVLEILAHMWTEQRQTLLRNAADITKHLRRAAAPPASPAMEDSAYHGRANKSLSPTSAHLARAAAALTRSVDAQHGGWGDAPKFPQPMLIEFLLHYAKRTGETDPAAAAAAALTAMARGGIYDHLGGGFHRYSTDQAWLVPHFEKMLYDNAQLSRAYLHAWQHTGITAFRHTCEETLNYVLRDMTDPLGGFYSTEDADSLTEAGASEEGAFYVWTPDQVRAVLHCRPPSAAETFLRVYGITDTGNFEGANVPHMADDPRSNEEITALVSARKMLQRARNLRARPARDDKVLTSWNGLMMAALAEAGVSLDRPDYTAAAERNAAFLLSNLSTDDGRLLHTWRAGEARHQAYLKDYAALCEGLIALHKATLTQRWLAAAVTLADVILMRFRGEHGELYDTADDHESLLVRPRYLQDNATPSGGSLAATAFTRLAVLTGEERYRTAALGLIESAGELITDHPQGFGQWLWTAELLVEVTAQEWR